MKFDQDAKYLESHEWVRMEDDEAICGISDHAQDELSDVVYVELPEVGETLSQGDEFGVVESVKSASDVYMPIGGKITAVNETLADEPGLINRDPYGEGWLIRFRPSDPAELDDLMSADEYEAFVAEEG